MDLTFEYRRKNNIFSQSSQFSILAVRDLEDLQTELGQQCKSMV
jgi:hypothetical protein